MLSRNYRNQLMCCDCVQGMQEMPDFCIPLTVTSPPFDALRDYGGHPFRFKPIADQLWRITAEGGVVVWVVREQIVDGSETGTSSEQRLYFRDLGFRLHHTMVMDKPGSRANGPTRYGNSIEYAFILSKGRPKTINLLRDWPVKHRRKPRQYWHRNPDGTMMRSSDIAVGQYRRRGAVWVYGTGIHTAEEAWVRATHPALMPEAMAKDFILSWSRPGDLVFDPMCGLGTTCKMALLSDRHYLGMEIFDKYAHLAKERMRLAHQQYQHNIRASLFRHTGPGTIPLAVRQVGG